GDFGDLTYKVNVDAMKKNLDYYFRINNFPSILAMFTGDLSLYKGQWIKVSTDVATSSKQINRYSIFGSLAGELPEFEKSYKENKEKMTKFWKEVIKIADEEKIVLFRSSPRNETIDGR